MRHPQFGTVKMVNARHGRRSILHQVLHHRRSVARSVIAGIDFARCAARSAPDKCSLPVAAEGADFVESLSFPGLR